MTFFRIEGLTTPVGGPFDFAVDKGECVTISGPSGCGKTVLLRAIVDLDPHDGQVFLNDIPATALSGPEWRRKVGLLPAESLWWFDQVGEHFYRPDQKTLGRLGFEIDVLSWPVQRLSTGERQRLSLARLLQGSPEVLLLDEPTASLDALSVKSVESVIGDIQRTGVPVIWVSHDPEQGKRVGSRSFYFEDRILVTG